MALWSLIPAAAQTAMSIVGMIQNSNKNKKALAYLNEDHQAYTPEKYKVSGEFMEGIQSLKSDSKRGFSDRTIRGFGDSLEDTRKSEVQLAKETSSGSGGSAFARAIASGVNKSKQFGKFMTSSEQYRDQKIGRYVGALGNLENINLAADSRYQGLKADESKTNINTALTKYQLAAGEQAAWGGAVNSGISNIIGSVQYNDFLKKINGGTDGIA